MTETRVRRRRRVRDVEGRMSLGEHVRELRRRVVIALVAVVAGAGVGWWLFEPIVQTLIRPLLEIDGTLVTVNFSGLTQPFAFQLKIALVAGVLLASPVWIWQIWGFLVPGLRRREKITALWFMAGAVPLFLTGCAVAAWVLPRTVAILLSFTPEDATALQDGAQYLNFILMFILAFGAAFLLPVFLIGLNTLRVLPAAVMLQGWRVAVMLILVFAAFMTPDPSAWTMLALAAPMVGLYFGAYGVTRLLERRRARRDPAWVGLPPEQAAPPP